MTPYYERGGITIYCADNRDVLPQLAPGSVDLVLTDPPYNVSAEGADIFYAGSGALPKKRDFGMWDRTDWRPDVLLHESYRLLRPGGSLLAFTSDRLLSSYRCGEGFEPRGTLVWDKVNPAPTPRRSYMSAAEWIVWLKRSGGPATWSGGGAVSSVLRFPICAGDERVQHPTQKPLALIASLLLRHSNAGDLVLDPFMGSGSTLRAAKDLGRACIGVEVEERYCEIAARRLEQEVLPDLGDAGADAVQMQMEMRDAGD